MEALNLYLQFLGYFFDTAWIWLPFALAVFFYQSWIYYIQRFYWYNLDWVMLEVKPPKEIEKTPKNMEQIFAGLWGSFGTVSIKYQKYIQGFMQDYFSFEIAGINGEIHFYIRTLRKYRDLIEAQIYSQYPQAEVKEVEDYAERLPKDVPGKNWTLWGCGFQLDRDSGYPIRTYSQLLDLAKTDEPFLDPLASLMEIMGKLKHGEQVWIQLLFRPAADGWRDQSRALADKLVGKPVKKVEGLISQDFRTWGEALGAVGQELMTGQTVEAGAKKEDNALPSLMQHLSPGEKDIVAGVEEKAAKKGYEVKMQWAYIARRELFNGANISAVMGDFNQFANLNMNSFKPHGGTMTKANYAFAKVRLAFRQRILMKLLRERSFWEKGFILNIEELATVYHFPTLSVKAPMTPFIDSKKGGAPIDLPVE